MNTTRRNLMRAGRARCWRWRRSRALAAPEFRYKYANNLPRRTP